MVVFTFCCLIVVAFMLFLSYRHNSKRPLQDAMVSIGLTDADIAIIDHDLVEMWKRTGVHPFTLSCEHSNAVVRSSKYGALL